MSEQEVENSKITLKKVLKGIWLFCAQVFIPQWGKHPKDYGQDRYLEEQMTKQGESKKS